jgi:putative SOS response-associated peptidase YedK
MCGRFVRKRTTHELASEFNVDEVVDALQPSFNIAPTHDVAAVVTDQGRRRLVKMRWGLVPWWATDPTIGSRLINARAESLTTKSAFKDSFRSRRCLVPADGFYEWQKHGQFKIPLLIHLKSDRPFAFAGLYDVWKSPLGPPLTTCTIITTSPNKLVEPIHDRMPVILSKEAEAFWLDRSIEDSKRLLDLLTPYTASEMEAYEVSSMVNSVKNDSPELIKPAVTPQPGLLF